jgi:restriction system protein
MKQRNQLNGPQFVRFITPVVQALNDLGGSGRPQEVYDWVAERMHISEQERNVLKKDGSSLFENQVAWARFYLAKSGYIDASMRGIWSLTDKGRLLQMSSFEDGMKIYNETRIILAAERSTAENIPLSQAVAEEETKLSAAPSNLKPSDPFSTPETHREKLRNLLQSIPAAGFERLCQRLLREAGFQQVIVTGRTGDGGIDGHGVLQLNPLVSFKVLFQCKRYIGSVGASQIRDFRGAMQGRADKGIILTTGTFTNDAQKEALRDGVPAIELVDGEKLMDMFENLELGLVPRKAFDLDLRFFQEFQDQ